MVIIIVISSINFTFFNLLLIISIFESGCYVAGVIPGFFNIPPLFSFTAVGSLTVMFYCNSQIFTVVKVKNKLSVEIC